MAIVYIHTKKNTNKVFYVGIGKSSKRAYQIQNRNHYWKNIVEKYGFDIKITHQSICWEEACSIEKYLISFYKDVYKLSNLTEGGEGIVGFKKTIEMKNNSRLGMLGKKNMLGKKQSPQTIEKIRQKNIGKVRSEDFKKRMKEISKKRTLSSKTRKKISLALSGENASWYGKFGSEHNCSKEVEQYSMNGNLINRYGSFREAQRLTKISHISCCCNGYRKTAGGYIWKYK